jgi:hypothetical protein
MRIFFLARFGPRRACLALALLIAGAIGLSACNGELLPQACSAQTLIGIDPVNNIAYVPIYSLDRAGNAQLAVVDLTIGTAVPVLKTISLTAAVEPIALAYNPYNQTILADARHADNNVFIYEIDTTTQSVRSVVAATGLVQQAGSAVKTRPITLDKGLSSNPQTMALIRALHTRQWAKRRAAEITALVHAQPAEDSWGPITIQPLSGGIVEDLQTNRAIVAGTTSLGFLDTSASPPIWHGVSIANLNLTTESFSLNSSNGLLFISNLGTDALIDTTKLPLSEVPFQRVPNKGQTDGVAFDIVTNIAMHSEFDGADESYAFNLATLDTTQNPAAADPVAIPGLGFESANGLGLGPGGQTVINCASHQALVADEFGPNLKLVQMPAAPVAGPLDNNGQPGSGTSPDAASVYTVAATVIPMGEVGGVKAPLGIIDSPTSLTIDPLHNFAYMLADDGLYYHTWTPGSTLPLFLVRVDLSGPVFGASPTGGVNGKTFWTPSASAIPLP